MSQLCPKCGSTEIDYDPTRGDSCCVECGFVLEQNAIISEVTFVENANGTSSAVGRFVSSTSAGGAFSGLSGMGRDSREITLANGRRKINQLANSLRLSSHHSEAAERLFMLAMQHNFIRGRRTIHVIASCLYIVCRREKTPHMLIDFSDIIQTNLYVLGNTFLKFCRLLNLRLPIIDPSLFIHRFAAKLEFEEKTHAVSMTALRIVARMKRDWIQTGRRPSGVCGAALLIAARMHGFRRTQKEIIYVVHICEMTLKKRLEEFGDTPSGQLTMSEFEKVDLEDTCYPPAFIRSQKKKGIIIANGSNLSSPVTPNLSIVAEPDATVQNDIEREMTDVLTNPETLIEASLVKSSQGKDILSVENGINPEDTEEHVIDPDKVAEETLSEVDDSEIDCLLNRPEEIEVKGKLWEEINKEYIEEQEEKLKQQAEELENGTSKPPKRQYSKKAKANGEGQVAENAAEAARNMLEQRKSRNVNYDALKDLFNLTPVIEVSADKLLKSSSSREGQPPATESTPIKTKESQPEGEDEMRSITAKKSMLYKRSRDAYDDDY